ncbi:MAG TPA: DUF2071 domain-containing protein [Mycobacteriales bacterium]|nr:DUF2071 domain-containing protein [Mycobacteriales bacterium]
MEPITPTSPRPVRRTVFTQAWLDLAFVHWALDPDVVAPLLPAGVRPDVLDGMTQVGLIAFRMQGIGIGPTPGIPYFGSFAETNVRLYTVDEAGQRGVYFLSLDATRLVPVLVARALGVPYLWSRMAVTSAGGEHAYDCRRRWPGPRGLTSRLVVRSGPPVTAPTELERFVTARWGLHLAGRTGTAYWPNEHPEWPLHRAELVHADTELLTAAGLPRPAAPPTSVLWSPGVRVRFGPKRPVRRP